MATFKTKIENTSNTSVRTKDTNSLKGIVIQADERTNRCTIRYKDNDGSTGVMSDVYVNIPPSGSIQWFPSKGDAVSFSKYLNYGEIYGSAEYHKSFTPNDTLTNLSLIGGTII